MKPFQTFAFLLISAAAATAQTNTYPWPASGNVGIGTTIPASRLHVGGSTSDVISVGTFSYSSIMPLAGLKAGEYPSGEKRGILEFQTLHWNCNPYTLTTDMTISNGNVGIGTTSPGTTLHVVRNDGLETIRVDDAGYGMSGVSLYTESGNVAARNWFIGNALSANGSLGFHVSGTRGGSPLTTAKMVIDSGGNVGIGTTSPNSKLEVYGGTSSGVLRLSSSSSASYGEIRFSSNDTSYLNYGASIEGTGDSVGVNVGDLRFKTGYGEMPVERMRVSRTGNVGIGTTNPTEKLSVNGKIRAKEVIVETTGWSDFVFAEDYKLASLSEVEQHIQQQGHLPGVPSATEVAEKGVSVGDMQAVLLAKVEELTLHLIAQEKEIARLRATEKEIVALRAEVQQLHRSK